MAYSFIFKIANPKFQFGRTTKSILQTCNRVNSVLPIHISSVAQRPVLQKLTEPLPDLSKLTLKHSRLIHVGSRLRNTGESGQKDSSKVSISKSQPPPPGLSATQKVKQAGKDFTYLIVVLIGLGVTGGLLYVVFQELFSSSSPSKIYGKAFNKCRSHPEVIGAFGEPIKGYGETTRRGRRQQVSHVEYLKDGLKHMRLKFYIEGSEPGIKGTVHSESKEATKEWYINTKEFAHKRDIPWPNHLMHCLNNPETGKYEFRYIFVDVDSYPRRTIVVEDNR